MRTFPFLIAIIGLGIFADQAQAQRWYRSPGRSAVRFGAGLYGGGYGRYGGYGGGYSPVEGAQRGMADVIRSRGQAAEDYSKARINNEEAKSKYLDNKLKWTDIYWKRKRLGEAELAKDYAKDRERRDKWKEANRGRKPETLPPSQFDAQTGGLEWPDALQGPLYADHRRQIEAELLLQAQTGTTSNTTQIMAITHQMKSILKGHIKQMSANEYIAARKFLDRLINQMAMAQSA